MNRSKVLISLTLIAAVFSVVAVAQAQPDRSTAELNSPGTARTLTLPLAAAKSPVISLGSALDPQTGQVVEGYAIVRYKDQPAKPAGRGKGGSTCYAFLGSGVKWKTPEFWRVNGANTRGLDAGYIYDNLSTNIDKWEDAADGTIGNTGSVDILGYGISTTSTLAADTAAPDGTNEVYFANISESGAIGVTIVWGVFGGPPRSRQLVEWDQVYDDTDFDWSAAGEAGKMDFENIATHELGHSIGLADLYTDACANETMYGYAAEGQTNKRSLEAGDIAGVSKLY